MLQPSDAQVLQAPVAAQQAFGNLGFGMFIHFGAYSQMADGEWVMEHKKITAASYEHIVEAFNPARFDARAIAKVARQA